MEIKEIPSNLRPHCFVTECGASVPQLTHYFIQQQENPEQWTIFLLKPNPFCQKDEDTMTPILSLGCFIIHIKHTFGDEYDWLGDRGNIFTIGWTTGMERNDFKKFIIDKLK